MKKNFISIATLFLFFAFSVQAAMSSQNYRIDEDSLSFGEVPAEREANFLETNFNKITERAFSKIQESFDIFDNFIILWLLIGFLLLAILLGVILKIKRRKEKTKPYSKSSRFKQ